MSELLDPKKMCDSFGRFYATGRRKSAVARVWIKSGSGNFIVGTSKKDRRSLDDYLRHPHLMKVVRDPFVVTKTDGKYDVFLTVSGGGVSGQASAIAHGISKALSYVSVDFHKALRAHFMLTRDCRIVERKKYGHHKARKSPQYSKR